MINDFCVSLARRGAQPASLFRKSGNLQCQITRFQAEMCAGTVTVEAAGYRSADSENGVYWSQGNFCVLHGESHDTQIRALSAQQMFTLVEQDGIGTLANLTGNFVAVVCRGHEVYVFAPKTPGATVFYSAHDGGVFLASDVRSLPHNNLGTGRLLDELELYTDPGKLPWPDVRTLTSGHFLRIALDQGEPAVPRLFQYWYPSRAPIRRDTDTLVKLLRSTLQEAVGRIRSEAVTSFISGGLDSSAVTALAAMSGKKITTFSVGTASANEFREAEVLARHIDSEHENIEVTYENLLTAYAEVVALVGHPFSTYIEYLVPGYLAMAKVVGAGETVLSGYGSDVLFAGFARAGMSFASIADLIQTEYRTTLWSGEASHNLINVDGVAVVYPFFDDRVVETALSISPELKFRDGWEKWILRKVGEQFLPPEIAWRRKIGIHQTTGMEAFLSHYVSLHCPAVVEAKGLRRAKNQFSFELLKELVVNRVQPSNIDFEYICRKVEV